MKTIIKILLLISVGALLKLEIINVEKIINTTDNTAFQILHTNSKENIINPNSGGAIRLYNLITLFINNDLYGFNLGILIPEVDIPGDRIQIQTKEVNKMVSFPKMSNSELKKSRIEYYAAKRRVDTLENKVAIYMKIIDTGKRQRVKVDKVTREKTIETVKLTDVQIKDVKSKLVSTEFQLLVAIDELKQKDFGFSKATGAITEKIVSSKHAYIQKKADEKVEDVKALVNRAVMNGGLQSVLDVQILAADAGDIKRIKSELMKIVRKENENGYPIRSLSVKTVNIIMAGLLNWNAEKSELPFSIS